MAFQPRLLLARILKEQWSYPGRLRMGGVRVILAGNTAHAKA